MEAPWKRMLKNLVRKERDTKPLSKYTELIFDIDKSIHELDDPKLATELRLDLFSLLAAYGYEEGFERFFLTENAKDLISGEVPLTTLSLIALEVKDSKKKVAISVYSSSEGENNSNSSSAYEEEEEEEEEESESDNNNQRLHDIVKTVKEKRIEYEKNRLKRKRSAATKEPSIAKVQPLTQPEQVKQSSLAFQRYKAREKGKLTKEKKWYSDFLKATNVTTISRDEWMTDEWFINFRVGKIHKLTPLSCLTAARQIEKPLRCRFCTLGREYNHASIFLRDRCATTTICCLHCRVPLCDTVHKGSKYSCFELWHRLEQFPLRPLRRGEKLQLP